MGVVAWLVEWRETGGLRIDGLGGRWIVVRMNEKMRMMPEILIEPLGGRCC